MSLLALLFFVVAAIVGFVVYASMLDAHVMPAGCPSCFHATTGGLTREPVLWYQVMRPGAYRCRHCGARFKEHPDGSLVRDADV